ncbi:MAG: hypothetical protein IPP74_15345 [Alphaproteobacteria bacterium]|nr:hypothetical protein [Alphaproteobacteria bacterium]
MKNITAIIQARMSSSRLPGKVLMPLGDVPILELIIRRLRLVERIDAIIVATSDGVEDDPIVQLCAIRGWRWCVVIYTMFLPDLIWQ